MSRRCDREGLQWPRLGAGERDTHGDVLQASEVLRGVYRLVRATHQRVLAHLRERPLLPPWSVADLIWDKIVGGPL